MLHLYGVLLTAWMYFTPIFYPARIIPEKFQGILYGNPMYYYIECFRDIVLYGKVPELHIHLICLGYGVAALLIGMIIFYKNQNKFILYV
jgi:ABC-2 type transport system permease protein